MSRNQAKNSCHNNARNNAKLKTTIKCLVLKAKINNRSLKDIKKSTNVDFFILISNIFLTS